MAPAARRSRALRTLRDVQSDDLDPVFLASGFGRLGRVGGDGGLTGFPNTTLHIFDFWWRRVEKGAGGWLRRIVDRVIQQDVFLPLLL